MLTRALTVFYVILCFAMGLVLFFAPWLSNWTSNFFVQHYLWLDALARNDYFRGGITGIGLADVGLGAYETQRLRKRSRTPEAVVRTPNEPPLSVP